MCYIRNRAHKTVLLHKFFENIHLSKLLSVCENSRPFPTPDESHVMHWQISLLNNHTNDETQAMTLSVCLRENVAIELFLQKFYGTWSMEEKYIIVLSHISVYISYE